MTFQASPPAMVQRDLRKAIRSDRMREVFDAAIRAGWIPKMRGSGHIRMYAPDDTHTFLTISVTASGARSALNVEAVLKRWLRQQEPIVTNEKIESAIDRQEAGISIIGREPEPESERPTTVVDEAFNASLAADKPDDTITCPECGRTFKRYGYGNHLAGHRRGKQADKPVKPEPMPAPNGATDLFSINEIVTIANFGGAGGLIEVSKLRDGLVMVARLRRSEGE